MNKKILISLSTIAAVAAVAVGGTRALFSDTETSNGNIFTAGAIDLKVDHTYASYDGQECVGECTEEDTDLIVNGGFEDPNLSNGQWQVYTGTTVPGWAVVGGAGLEIQDHAAGNPHGGSQLAELDSHGAGSQSTIEQVISTVPGQKYRLTFWHSPRPNNGPAGDNTIAWTVLVTSTSGVMINSTVENSSIGGSATSWTQETYNFIALDTQTTVKFADAGNQADTLGGYLDDIAVHALNCTPFAYTNGGTCTLWGEKDLTQGDTFWNFTDVKPGDYGTNVISLHVYTNDAYVCLLPTNIQDDENGLVDPEVALGDDATTGELSGELQFFVWNDKNNNGVFDAPTEDVLVNAGTPMRSLNTMIPLALSSPAPIDFVGFTWCAGTQTGPSTSSDTPAVSCDGNGMGNKAQTDKVISDFVAYAVQQRNNSEFSCDQVDLTPAVAADSAPH